MPIAVWWIIALGAGLCSTLQSAVNGNITRTSGAYTAMASNAIFYTVGTVLYLLYGVYQKQLSLSQVTSLRPDQHLGGVFGFGVVLFLTLSFPRLGAMTTMALMILGQSLVALLVDSKGLWGVPLVAVSGQRLIAVALILAGVVLLNKI